MSFMLERQFSFCGFTTFVSKNLCDDLIGTSRSFLLILHSFIQVKKGAKCKIKCLNLLLCVYSLHTKFSVYGKKFF